MAEPDRPAPRTQHQTEEPAMHPQQPTDQHDTGLRATAQRGAAVHPELEASQRNTAVLRDGDSTSTPSAAPAPVPASKGRRSPDLLALTAGVAFCLVAVLGLVGTSLPGWMFGGGFFAVVLVVAGAGLLINELRCTR